MKNHNLLTHVILTLVLGSAGITVLYYFPSYVNNILPLVFLSILFTAFLAFRRESRQKKEIQKLVNATSGDLVEEVRNYLYRTDRRVETALHIIKEVGKLDRDQEQFQQLFDTDDELIHSLQSLDERLISFSRESRQRSWANEGLARLAEILRADENMEHIADKALSFLTKYIQANHAAFYLYDKDPNEKLELLSCYAYGKKKHLKRTVEPGEGLVGQMLYDKDLIYITDVPDDYVNITSGLGEALPRHILLIPLMVNESFQGTIEFASFKIHEDYEIDFLKEAAESIAATLANVRTNEKTRKLLNESQQLAVELRSNEEEMRQNMEELEATQEEIARKASEMGGLINAVDSTLFMAEFDTRGDLIRANNTLCTLLGKPDNDLKGLPLQYFLDKAIDHQTILNRVSAGETISSEYQMSGFEGIYVEGTCAPVFNQHKQLEKILLLGKDITLRKEQEAELERLSLVADNTDNSVVICDAAGGIEFVNEGFEKLTGYKLHEIRGRKPGSFLQGPKTDKDTVKRISEKLRKGETLYEEILNYKKSGESYWISLTINPIFDDTGRVDKYIAVQANITETKEKALDFQYKLEAIDRSNAIIEFDLNGYIKSVNDIFLNIVKYTRYELIGQHHSIFVKEKEKNSREYKKFWDDLRSGKSVKQEFKRIDKFGREIWLEGVYSPIFDIEGRLLKISKFAIDVTVKHKLSTLSKKQELEIKSQMAAIGNFIAFVEFDLRANIVNANDLFLKVSGYNMQQIFGSKYKDLFRKKDQDSPQVSMIWDNLVNGSQFTGEFTMADVHDNPMYLYGSFHPMVDNETGEITRLMMFAQFITGEKRKQNELSTMVEGLKKSAPVLEINPDGSLKKANKLFFDLFGISRMQLTKLNIHDILVSELDSNWLSDEYHERELIFKTIEDIEVKFRTTFTAVKNLEGDIERIFIILFNTEHTLSHS